MRVVLPVGAFPREAEANAGALAAAGVALAEVAVFGRLATNGPYGPLQLVARAVDPRSVRRRFDFGGALPPADWDYLESLGFKRRARVSPPFRDGDMH